MKKTLLLAALFLALGSAAWYALNQKKSQQASHISWDLDFAVKNPSEIGKIFLADRKGNTATLERRAEGWVYNGQYPARPTAVQSLLEAVEKVNVRYIPPAGTEAPMIKSLAAEGIKIEIYDRAGKPLKVYYVGGVTADERGTFMMMDGAERPYVVHLPAFTGQVRVRYMLGDDNWRDRGIFKEKPEEIQSISVEYPQKKSGSFRLEKLAEAKYEVKPFFSTTPENKSLRRKGVAEGYLLQFENCTAEAFETENPFRDSVSALVPFAIVTLKKADGSEKQVRFWPTKIDYDGQARPYVNRYFAEVNRKDFMLVQHRVFEQIFKEYDFFFDGTPQRLLN
jgi:hypothetical protein